MIVCIVGPTGVGKTLLSISLAKKYNGVVVNGDATQIYEELNIGSAKIKEEEKEGIPHYLFNLRKPNESYSVADYQKDLRNALEKLKNKNIFIVGGTGLYLTAGLYDYNFSKMNENDYEKYTNNELYQMCLEINPNHKIDKNNRIRLINYLNREDKTTKPPKLLYDVLFIGLTSPRNIVYDRINARVDEMFSNGLVEEVKTLREKYGEVNILKRAIGYKEIISYLNGDISLEEAKDLIKKNSRHYAKRQYTWFNNKMDVVWFQTNYEDFSKTINEINLYIDNNYDKIRV